MQTAIQATPPKVVHTIPATINLQEEVKNAHNHSEKGQFGLVHMAALIGTDQFNLSHTIGMALRNAAKNKKMDYSKRGEIDLFQTI